MKRCHKLSAVIYVLALASLFSFTSCGIPYFINLDNTIIWTKNTANTTDQKIDTTLTITTQGMQKINEVNATPSIKFFYVISANKAITAATTNNNDINANKYPLTTISSQFSNFKGKVGNGLSWFPEPNNRAAPGFYLYTKDDNTYRNFARERSAIRDLNEDESGIIVGTFSQSTSLSNDQADYFFGKSPEMDALLPITSWSASGDFTYNFTLERVAHPLDLQFGVEFNPTGGPQSYFASYQRNLFPQSNDETDLANFISEDPYFHKPFLDGINNLYVHIWATVYGGNGLFTNIYWSNLEYLGTIKLF